MTEESKMERFNVVSWDTGEILHADLPLGLAKRYARGEGHTGEDNPILTGYPPIAYVADRDGNIVYNPHFGKRLGAAVAGFINAQPSSHF